MIKDEDTNANNNDNFNNNPCYNSISVSSFRVLGLNTMHEITLLLTAELK